jgi:poly(3-hydroxybutyrate) depolymerase
VAFVPPLRRVLLSVAAPFLLITSANATSSAAPSGRVDFPCKGCLFEPPPEGATKAPLLVVLHGDAPGGKTPLVERDTSPWRKAGRERGIAVLSPFCPREEGCRFGSYWQWTQGDPLGWMQKQIDLVAKAYSIDPDRIWIAGWSGGASFLGYHYQELSSRFAAVVFVGGGMPNAASSCSKCSLPAYFLVGDRNPLHHLAKALRVSVEGCTSELTWDLVPGKDHAGEWRAITEPGKAGAILDWLAKHPRQCGADAGAEAQTEAGTGAEAGTEAEADADADAGAAADAAAAADPLILPPRSHCGCFVAGGRGTGGAGSFLIAVVAATLRFIRVAFGVNRTGRAAKTAS